ncbi:lipid A-modifier LpxR family protein [Maritimibacter sp. HL-12]|uniref:lipid A-modifier LpxR family protein n=1 Tax=Maritimibacter sp. HL-12 TaxID=1162418 RepID=UPI000A0EF689|nr:lipid A-modifier LpxR family protein [Maritimibacter sp. HL-12]SMH40274.1 hypothetical protein SAMN05661107_1069 [Maritimibacter sp. HL-12]
MRRLFHLVAGLVAALALAAPAMSETPGGRGYLGWSYLINNDWLGDGDDRWQSGGSSNSFLFGPAGLTEAPEDWGRLIEVRSRFQVISPDNFTAPAAWDRRAAGVITTTLNTHVQRRGFELSAGAGLAFTGPRTGLIRFQNRLHELTPANDPMVPPFVAAAQIGDAVYPTLQGEAARRFRLSDHAVLRPFVEVQAGVESLARIGADLFIGPAFDGGLLLRDGTSGFAYRGLDAGGQPGVSLVIGADTARVFSSALLPAADGYRLTPLRHRARAGVMFEGDRLSVFYGGAWLGREFAAQPRGQVSGVLQVNFRF